MDEKTKAVQAYYDTDVELEWNRIANRPEFLLTCRMLDRYIKSGDTVLDIGGGPGRYSLYLAERGCNVTLVDLSPKNTAFALEEAGRRGLFIKAVAGDACVVDSLVKEQVFDHVLLMGPLYHLLEESQRTQAVNAALNVLKPGGVFFASFLTIMGGMIYFITDAPSTIIHEAEAEFIECFKNKKSFVGMAFTNAFFIEQSEILPFMTQFALDKLHLFGQEGMISASERNIMSQPKEVVDVWLDLCEKTWEREELLSWSQHLMYVGRKR